jgi:oligosaccharyltransferase complex subunit delta (ribophorin II)
VVWGNAESVLNAALVEGATSETIWHIIGALTRLGLKVDSTKVIPLLDATLKADDSPLSYAYTFYAASLLKGDLKKIQDSIEDVIAQADEIDEKYLQFENGLLTTALVVDSAYQFATSSMTSAPIPEDKLIKFANYFLSRKHTQTLKDAASILQVITMLTRNKFHVPIAVTLASPVAVSTKSPSIQVRVSNLLGLSLGKLTVTAETARHLGDDAVVLSKKPFVVSLADPSLFELDLMKVNPERGFYRVVISITSQSESKLIGTTGAEVEVKVIGQVAIENVEVSIIDKEHTSVMKSTKLQLPNKVQLEADHHQKITTRFMLKDTVTGKPMTAHQTFIRLTNLKTKQEVIFVAEEDDGDTYRFDLDVGARSKDFNNLSGKYTMELIIGDAVIENPISWTMADVQLTLGEDIITKSFDEQYRYSMKPEIKHLFREPEKRPPAVVSNFFTVLVLLPLLILIILWIKIGANISNFSCSLSAIGFHLGLIAIFSLYLCYFLHLNMFSTLRYLGIIGLPTFLFGNKLLSGIAARRK